jgi:FkbM family methyltransferase
VIIDVGANKGDYSLMVLAVNPDAKIIAFEPHPKTYLKLKENFAGKNVNSFNKALGSDSGLLNLFDYESNDGSTHASIYKGVIEEIHNKVSLHHQVQVEALDKIIANLDIKNIRLLKIDTEGHELEVIRGCSNALRNQTIDYIHFEFNEMNVISRIFLRDFFALLSGYELYRLLPRGMIKIDSSPLNSEIFAYQNIVAVKNGII